MASNYSSVSDNNRIIDMKRYNGRVNILEPESPEVAFQMFEKVAVKNKATEYRGALAGTWENNVLAQVFFSVGNIQILQNGMRAGVYAMSNNKYVIPPQNIDALKIVMRSIYLQYAKHYVENITRQVEELNKLVLDYCVPFVYNESHAYMKYLQDQSSLVVPMALPQHHDREYKQLELKNWV